MAPDLGEERHLIDALEDGLPLGTQFGLAVAVAAGPAAPTVVIPAIQVGAQILPGHRVGVRGQQLANMVSVLIVVR